MAWIAVWMQHARHGLGFPLHDGACLLLDAGAHDKAAHCYGKLAELASTAPPNDPLAPKRIQFLRRQVRPHARARAAGHCKQQLAGVGAGSARTCAQRTQLTASAGSKAAMHCAHL